MTPRVAVIVPCYNLGRYLDEAIDSVLAQSFQDVEIVVVDDGSSDSDTRARLDAFDRPRTRVIRSANRGLPAAKNLGLAETSAPYVCMFDADDRLLPDMLAKSVAALDDDARLAFVSHWVRHFGDESFDWAPTDCGFPALLDVNTVNGAALVRRSALDAVGGFDETMRDGCEDWDVWIALVERGFRGRILEEVLYEYRRRPESMSRVMVRGDGHPRLYRRIVEKHATTFAGHVGPLMLRRERDLAALRRHAHDLGLEYDSRLAPALASRRDDVAVLEKKAARLAQETAEEEARARERAALHDEIAKARREIDDIRRSASWTITAPLRAIYDMLGLARARR